MSVVVKSVRFGETLVLEDLTTLTVDRKYRYKNKELDNNSVIIIIKRDKAIGKIAVVKQDKEEVNGNK